MGLQKIVRDHIIADPTLTALIPADRWCPAGSFTSENIPERRFAVMRWGVVNPGVGEMKRHSLTIWIHDDLGGFTGINEVLGPLDARMNGATPVPDGSGSEILVMEWAGTSGNLYDPGYRTNTRTITYTVIGKGV